MITSVSCLSFESADLWCLVSPDLAQSPGLAKQRFPRWKMAAWAAAVVGFAAGDGAGLGPVPSDGCHTSHRACLGSDRSASGSQGTVQLFLVVTDEPLNRFHGVVVVCQLLSFKGLVDGLIGSFHQSVFFRAMRLDPAMVRLMAVQNLAEFSGDVTVPVVLTDLRTLQRFTVGISGRLFHTLPM